MLTPLLTPVKLKGKLFCGFYTAFCREFVSAYCSPQAWQLNYEELNKSMDALSKSSVDNLPEKIRHLASRPVPEFNRFEALDVLEALKNAAQDTKHQKAGYFRLALETLRERADEPNDQSCNFLLRLFGDKDQEKVLEMVAKGEKNNRRKPLTQKSGPGRRAMGAPYMGVRCYYCNRPGHIQINCFTRKRDLGGPSGFSRGAPQPNVNANQNK